MMPGGISKDGKDSVIVVYNKTNAIFFRPVLDEIRRVRASPSPRPPCACQPGSQRCSGHQNFDVTSKALQSHILDGAGGETEREELEGGRGGERELQFFVKINGRELHLQDGASLTGFTLGHLIHPHPHLLFCIALCFTDVWHIVCLFFQCPLDGASALCLTRCKFSSPFLPLPSLSFSLGFLGLSRIRMEMS